MAVKPLPPFAMPLTFVDKPTQLWQDWFGSVDQALRAGSSFPTPEVTLNNASNQTLTAAQLLAGLLLRTGPVGAFSDTTPSAASIVALIPKAYINFNRMVLIRNGGGGLMTILAGVGVTLQGTTTIAAGNARFYLVTVTAKNIGAESVNIRGLITGAM